MKTMKWFALLLVLSFGLLPLGIGAGTASANSLSDWYWTDNYHMSPNSTGSARIVFNTTSSQALKDIIGSTTNTTPYKYDVYASGWYAGNEVGFDQYSEAPMPDMWNDKNISTLVGYNGFRYQPPVWITTSYYLYPRETVNFYQQYLKKIVNVSYIETDSKGNVVYEARMVMTLIHYQGPSIQRAS